MSMPRDRELVSVYIQANDIARQVEQVFSSAHLLLALFTVPNQAAIFLEDRSITVDELLRGAKRLGPERADIIDRVQARMERIAHGSQATHANSLHLFAALIRESSSHAYTLLGESGANVSALRASIMSYATGSRTLPRTSQARLAQKQTQVPAVAREIHGIEHAPSPIGIHPSLKLDTWSSTQTTTLPPETVVEEPEPVSEEPSSKDLVLDEARNTAKKLAESLFRRRKEILKSRELEELDPPKECMEEPDSDIVTVPPMPVAELEVTEVPDAPEALAPARGTEYQTMPPNTRLANAYALDPEVYPTLCKYGRNLTEDASLGKIDRVVGRDREILQLIDIVGKRRSNNPIIVGEAGVGKTAIVEGLAREFVRLAARGNKLGRRAIVELEVGQILGGTHLRGSFSERISAIKDEVRRAEGDIIVFLDEIHMWMNAGSGGDGTDAAGELKTALARGEFPCIGATTNDEFRRFVEADAAFERRFQVVHADEPSIDDTLEILNGIRHHYEYHHEVKFDDDALEAGVRLSHRFMHERRLPDKAIGVLDLAGSRAARTGQEVVDRDSIARVVAELAGIPPERLTRTDRERFLQMEKHLGKSVIGHTSVISCLSEVVRRNYAGFRSSRPIGSFLFLGPTGVGKTELVKVLADFLFFERDAMVRFDMSEFMEAHSVSRLIGAPPGYVGYEKGGQLTESVRRRPYQVVLLDEIEKAHPDVLNILLQLLDEGRLTDGRGRHVDFSNSVVIMTSNLGSEVFDTSSSKARSARIGFGIQENPEDEVKSAVFESARSHFPPELWNRIDERLVFMPLTRPEVAKIAALQLADTARRLKAESGIGLVFSEEVVRLLIDSGGFDPQYGARPMRNTIQRLVEGGVARLILEGDTTRGDTVYVDVQDEKIIVYAEA